jgi:uncharacterized protein YkwD
VRLSSLTVVAAVLATGLITAATIVHAVESPIMHAARPGETAARLELKGSAAKDEERTARLLVELLNGQRAASGLPPYQFNASAAAAAAAHSADQAQRRKMSHTGSDGSNAGQRLTRHAVMWGTWGENVGAGFDDPAALLKAWLASPTHRPIVLSPTFTHVGVGAGVASDGTRYWTMDAYG